MQNYPCLAVLATLAAAAGPSTAAEEAATVSAGREGFSIESSDGRYQLGIGGMIQVDGRLFSGDEPDDAVDQFLIRRARLNVHGDLGDRLSFRIQPESSNGETRVLDAYFDSRLNDRLTLRAGKFKPPIGLERLQSAADLRLIERSFVSELVPSRDVGAQIAGDAGPFDWALGVFNGAVDGRTADTGDDGKAEVAARLMFEPLGQREDGASLGVGFGMSYGDREGAPDTPLLPAYRSAGQLTIFSYRDGTDATFADGSRLRMSPQLYWYRGPFGLMAEWARVREEVRRSGVSRAATLENDAWEITGEWFVTGEQSGYQDPDTTGALQVVARVSGLEPDAAAFDAGAASFADPAVAVSRARSAALGVNWFPLAGLKASILYQQTEFDDGASGGDRPTEKLVLARLQQTF